MLPDLPACWGDPPFVTCWSHQCHWGLGLVVLVNEMELKPQWRVYGAARVSPWGGGHACPGVMWHHRPSTHPSVPLQPEPKELKREAVAGGERFPFPGWPFQRGHSAFKNLGAGRPQHWGCPPSLGPRVPTAERGGHAGSWHHGTAPTPRLSPNGPCPRPRLGPWGRSCQGGAPSLSLCGR